jgi:UDP-N-acetylmuramate--alanine ligase
LPGHVLFYGVCEDNNEINAITKYDYFARNISFDECGHGEFDLMHSLKSQNSSEKIMHIKLGVVGMHNVSNATAAVALCLCLGISIDKIIDALAKFHGAKRRFEIKGKLAGCVTIIDDYAHHPSEIRATLNAAHKYPHKTIWTVFQPHTYSRLRKFLPDFASSLILSDRIVLTDVYAAREKDPGDISSLDLLKKINELCPDNPSKAVYFSSFGEIEDFLLTNAVSGDIIFMMGAGSVIQIGDELLGRQTS